MHHFGPNVGHNIFDQYEMLQFLVVEQILKSVSCRMIERNAFHLVDWAPFVKQQILTDVGLSRFVIDFREEKTIRRRKRRHSIIWIERTVINILWRVFNFSGVHKQQQLPEYFFSNAIYFQFSDPQLRVCQNCKLPTKFTRGLFKQERLHIVHVGILAAKVYRQLYRAWRIDTHLSNTKRGSCCCNFHWFSIWEPSF